MVICVISSYSIGTINVPDKTYKKTKNNYVFNSPIHLVAIIKNIIGRWSDA